MSTPDQAPRTTRHARDPAAGGSSRRLHLFALVVCGALYAPWIGRGFTSEDFLLLRLLDEHAPWHDLFGLVSQPWLGVAPLGFYRPFAWLFFGLEEAAFGTSSLGYDIAHLAVHLWAVSRVFELVRRVLSASPEQIESTERTESTADGPAGGLPALTAALVFGLYPLAPNSVSWAASYANLFSVALVLTGLWCFVEARLRRSSAWGAVTAVVTVLALGSYEAAVVLPIGLVLIELLVFRARWRARLALAGACALALAAYLGLRRLALGASVGGYEGFLGILSGPPAELLQQIGRCLVLLVWPRFERPMPSPAAGWLALALLAGAVVAAVVALAKRPRWRAEVGLGLFGVGLVLVSLFPFGYRLVSPAEGRYFYPAAAGLAFALAALGGLLARLVPARGATAAALVLVVLPAAYAPRLTHHLRLMRQAADESTRLDAALARLARETGSERRIFVAETPRFVSTPRGLNLAQINHYGVRDRGRPPFSRREPRNVYPLFTPPRPAADALADVGLVVDWRDEALVRVPPENTSPPALRVAGSSLDPDQPFLRFTVPAGLEADRFEVVVVSGGYMLRTRFDPELEQAPDDPNGARLATAPRPDGFLTTMGTLYPDAGFFAWIEARDATGALLAYSKAAEIGRLPDASRHIGSAAQRSDPRTAGIPARRPRRLGRRWGYASPELAELRSAAQALASSLSTNLAQ